ncbi:MAG: hypothetical protein ACK5T6_17315 [Pirellula sp.]
MPSFFGEHEPWEVGVIEIQSSKSKQYVVDSNALMFRIRTATW